MLISRFDPFSDGRHFEAAREVKDGLDNGYSIVSLGEITNERTVDFDLVKGKASQIAEGRISRTYARKRTSGGSQVN
jgi:hypothetical protein